MDNVYSSAYSKIVVTEQNKSELDIKIIRKSFSQVVGMYVWFLQNISFVIVRNYTDDVEREKRKFNAVRRELLVFLSEHRLFFKVLSIELLSNDKSVLYTMSLDNSNNFEHFLNLDNVTELQLKVNSFEEMPITCYVVRYFKETMIRRIKIALNELLISDEDIQLFSGNHYLVDKSDLNNKCSNYNELRAYIENRAEHYLIRKVSTDHIYNMSFEFQGSIQEYEDEKSCCVCLEDYEKDQEICHLPCNHFCCRICTEEMFAIPEDGLNAHFQCPICRDDCT